MQVNFNIRPDIGVQGEPAVASRRVETQGGDQTNFNQTAAIENAFNDVPDARPEVVARGEQIIGSPQYPPLDGIRRISRLLAANWPPGGE
ncbi:MAG: hypothetical protein QOF48_3828 [Verrucomicrobiota bacterium]|jgi:hypothetical protein